MWYSTAQFNTSTIHILAYLGVVVNDLQLFCKKIIKMYKKRHNETDRNYQINNNRSKNYTVF